MNPDQFAARKSLGVSDTGRVIALLPGSRKAEVGRLGGLFLDTARILAEEIPGATFLIPCANERRKRQLLPLLEAYSDLDITPL